MISVGRVQPNNQVKILFARAREESEVCRREAQEALLLLNDEYVRIGIPLLAELPAENGGGCTGRVDRSCTYVIYERPFPRRTNIESSLGTLHGYP